MNDINKKPSVIRLPGLSQIISKNNEILFYPSEYNPGYFYLLKYPNFKIYSQNTNILDLTTNTDLKQYPINNISNTEFPNLNNDMLKFIQEFKDNYEYKSYYIKWNNYIILYNAQGDTAIISNTDVIQVDKNENYSYQIGDRDCCIFTLLNGDLLIRNRGDVSSTTIYTNNSIKLYEYDIDCCIPRTKTHQEPYDYDENCTIENCECNCRICECGYNNDDMNFNIINNHVGVLVK